MYKKGYSILSLSTSNTKIINYILDELKKEELNEKNFLWIIYQISGYFLNSTATKKILQNVKHKKIGWKDPIYENVTNLIQEHDDYIIKPFEVVDGVLTCPKCGGSKTWSIQRQTRSADEPMTTFSRCVMCGHNWKYSG